MSISASVKFHFSREIIWDQPGKFPGKPDFYAFDYSFLTKIGTGFFSLGSFE